MDVPVKIKIRIQNRLSFEELGSIGTSISSILRDAASAGAKDMAAGPEENEKIGLEFKKAKQGSLILDTILAVDSSWLKEVGKAISVKAAAEIVYHGLKKGLIYLLDKEGKEEIDDPTNQAKLLEKVERSATKLSELLEKIDSRGFELHINRRAALAFDDDDIKAFTVEPEPGDDLVVSAHPIQLHETTKKGWLRIDHVLENLRDPSKKSPVKTAAYRMQIEADQPDANDLILGDLARLFESNINGRTRVSTNLVVRPMVSKRGTVRHLIVRGFADSFE